MKGHPTVRILILSAALATPLFAEGPALTHLSDINVGSHETIPTAITYHDGDAYVAGFEQRRVLSIRDILTTAPSVEILYRSSAADEPPGPIEWNTSRGFFTIDFQEPNRVLVAGMNGGTTSDGLTILVNSETGEEIVRQAPDINGSPRPVAGAVFYGPSNIVAQQTAGSNYWQFNANLDGFTGPAWYQGPPPAASRDMAVDPDDGTIYISFNNKYIGDGTSIGIHRILMAGNEFSLSGNTNDPNWYTTTVDDSGSAQGIALLDHGGERWVVLALRETGVLRLINTADPSTTLTVEDDHLFEPAGVAIAERNGDQFVLVTQYHYAVEDFLLYH